MGNVQTTIRKLITWARVRSGTRPVIFHYKPDGYVLFTFVGGVARICQGGEGGSPSGDRRLYMVYTAALPRVSAGSVVLSRHEGPY